MRRRAEHLSRTTVERWRHRLVNPSRLHLPGQLEIISCQRVPVRDISWFEALQEIRRRESNFDLENHRRVLLRGPCSTGRRQKLGSFRGQSQHLDRRRGGGGPSSRTKDSFYWRRSRGGGLGFIRCSWESHLGATVKTSQRLSSPSCLSR